MPTKKSVSSSHELSGDVSTIPTKLLAAEDVPDMEIEGPAVITETIPGSDLSNSEEAHLVSETFDSIERLQVELSALEDANNVNVSLSTDILDSAIVESTPQEPLAVDTSTVVRDPLSSGLITSPDAYLSMLTDATKEVTLSSSSLSPTDTTDKIFINTSTSTSVTAKQVMTKPVVTPSTNSVIGGLEQQSLLASTHVQRNQQFVSSHPQQIRIIPVSQATASGMPIQIFQSHGSSSSNSLPQQIILTGVPGSPSKAVIKPFSSVPTSVLSSKQNLQTITLPARLSSPSKQNIVVGKVVSPSKSPTKIAMIPVSLAKNVHGQKFITTVGNPSSLVSTPLTVSGVSQGNVSVIKSAVSPSAALINTVAGATTSIQKIMSSSTEELVSAPRVVSPTKVIQVRGQTSTGPILARLAGPGFKQVASVPADIAGNKVQFIKVVTSTPGGKGNTMFVPVSTLTTSTAKSLASAITTTPNVTTIASPATRGHVSNLVRMAVPIAPAIQSQTVRQSGAKVPQKLIIPASSVAGIAHIRQTGNSSGVTHLPPGVATVIPGTGNSPGIVMVPAQYLNQLQNTSIRKATLAPKPPITVAVVSTQSSLTTTTSISNNSIITIKSLTAADKSSVVDVATSVASVVPTTKTLSDSNGIRPRKPCNCTKSQCLKLYCDCFANGEFCNNCNCNNCSNNLSHEEERQRAIKACLDRNPQAFHPKIGKGRVGEAERRHNKGCNCKRSGCLKNYCECYEAKILCSEICRCIGCKNYEESADRKSLMHLADAAEVRVQQQTDVSNRLSTQIGDVPSRPCAITSTGERLPFSFVTKEVVEATCECLLAQAEEAELNNYSDALTEKALLEEFGRCLTQIIDYAHKTRASSPHV